jgi:3-oxoadipate enol-lactonase
MGFGMTGAMWRPVVEELSPQHRCAIYDHPGLGASPGPAPRSMAGLAAAARGVLDRLGWERAHIVGISMGGMVAQELALEVPSRVISLVLLATHAGGPLGALPPWEGLLVLASPRSRGWKLQRLLYPRSFRRQDPSQLQQRTRAQLAQRVPREALRAQLRAVLGHDTRTRLQALQVPALVIEAGQDRLVRASRTRALAAAIPRCRYVRLPEAGHGLIVQEQQAVGALLREHFALHEPARADQNVTNTVVDSTDTELHASSRHNR